jgi:transcriptional activator Myb
MVAKLGVARSWSLIASHIPGRTGKQCRERWLNHTTQESKRGHWSNEEEVR